jgi:hypothetical protein
VSVDSGALLRGKRDSITSAAAAAAPTQGQRAAPPPAPAAAGADTGRPRARTDTMRPPVRTDTARRKPSAAATRPAAPVVRTPAPTVAPTATPTPARRGARYSVQVAAAHRRGEVDPDRRLAHRERVRGADRQQWRMGEGVGGRLSERRGRRLGPPADPRPPGRGAVRGASAVKDQRPAGMR